MIKKVTDQDYSALDKEFAAQLFEGLVHDSDGVLPAIRLKSMFLNAGFNGSEDVVGEIFDFIEDKDDLNLNDFTYCVRKSPILLDKLINNKLIIPQFKPFAEKISEIYDNTKHIESGQVASYIPQLARIDPDIYCVSICTVDGQTFNLGETKTQFSIQSVSKAINYLLALEEHGEQVVHSYIGEEPSGRGFNELTFNYKGMPFNPMTNAGGIMSASLIKSQEPLATRLEYIISVWKKLSGNNRCGFDAPTYLSERETGDRNFALGYLMREKNMFPPNTDLTDTLRFYFQCCSIAIDTESLAACGATLAKAGICPISGKRIAHSQSVANCLTLMYSCGLYDFSGEFAFYVGLPAKSGVSGCLLVVIPNVLGLAIYSPRLDMIGNTVRGIAFCKELVKIFSFHNWDYLLKNPHKIDPCLRNR